MTVIDFCAFAASRPPPPGGAAEDGALELDDLVSRGGDDLAFDVDATGHLVLVEGSDFD